ncbi:myosin-13-like isoform X2 [Oscarella lobularis]|uniref:myosin-13-like isoform X2 n=1 Tax=Oscarella lobularis TaxID=121494 RepID=UPI003313F205
MFKTCRVDQDKGPPGLTSCSPKPKSRIPALDVQAMAAALDPKATDLVRELSRERQLRLDAEKTCRDLQVECDRYKFKMQESQKSFNRIHAALETVRQYRHQIENLQQEKGQQQKRYESNLSRLREQIRVLEGQKGDLQLRLEESRCQAAEGSDKDVAQLLMRNAKLEKMNMQMATDATTQRQHFDRCLDKFASQVTKALMEQKNLKRENDELRRKNADLQRLVNHFEVRQQSQVSDDSGVSFVVGSKGNGLPTITGLDEQESYRKRTSSSSSSHKLKFCSSSDDLFNRGVSPIGIRPSPMILNRPSSGMRRVRSDNTPELLEYPGLMYRAESRESISSECSDVPMVNYWEMYQQRQKTVIPENLRRARQGNMTGMSPSTSNTSLFTALTVPQSASLPVEKQQTRSDDDDISGSEARQAKSEGSMLDPTTRLELLEDILGGNVDDDEQAEEEEDDGNDDELVPSPELGNSPPDAMEYVRCIRRRNMEGAIGHKNIIDFSQGDGFRRFGDDEEAAIREFEFLKEVNLESDLEELSEREGEAHLDSVAIGTILNGKGFRQSGVKQKTTSKKSKIKHSSSLTTIIGNIKARVMRSPRRSESPESGGGGGGGGAGLTPSLSLRSITSPSRIIVPVVDGSVGRRLANPGGDYTPTGTPEVNRKEKSTLI